MDTIIEASIAFLFFCMGILLIVAAIVLVLIIRE
jgi:hypothetical protein